MISFLALSTAAVTSTTQPADHAWSPLVSQRVVDQRETARHEPAADLAFEREMWVDAATEAAIPRLRAHIDSRVLFGGEAPEGVTAEWWSSALDRDPIAPAAALALLGSRYLVWHVDGWPASHAPVLPRYRAVLTKTLFEAYQALRTRAESLEAEIAGFMPVSLTPPEGLPFRSDPSYIKDAGAREEYHQRLMTVARQDATREELRRAQNIMGEYELILSGEVRVLYSEAAADEVRQLAGMIRENDWETTVLYQAIVKDWPGLGEAVTRSNAVPDAKAP